MSESFQPENSRFLSWITLPAPLVSRMYRYKALLKQHWWIFLLISSVVFFYEIIKFVTEKPLYQSTARMMVKMQVSMQDATVAFKEEYQSFFGTQMALMQSGEVQSRAQARVKALKPNLIQEPVALQRPQMEPRTSIFILKAFGESSEYTQAYLDSCMEEYMNFKKEMRSKTSEVTQAAIMEEVTKLEKNLRGSEDELFQFQKENNVVLLQEQGNSVGTYLANLNNDLALLKTEQQLLDAMIEEQTEKGRPSVGGSDPIKSITGPKLDGSSRMIDHAGEYAKARQQVEVLKLKMEEALKNLQPEHPKIIQMQQEISQNEQLMKLYGMQNLDEMKSRRDAIKIQTQALEKVKVEWDAKALDLNKRMAEYQRIKSKSARTQALYERLLSNMQNVGVNKNIDQETVDILERASPSVSIKTGIVAHLCWSLIISVGIAIMLLVFLDRVDDRLTTTTDLENSFKEPVLGCVPLQPHSKHDPADKHLLLDDSPHPYWESFRNIRSSISFMPIQGERPKLLVVTSAIPGEGKSTTAANLAITFASAGLNVLLVDADLRRGVIHKLFDIPHSPGLSDVLNQQVPWEQAVVAECGYPNLKILPRGTSMAKTGELLLRHTSTQMMQEIRSNYDCVIMDSAPIMATDDTSNIAPKADGLLFVIGASFTSARVVQSALNTLYDRQVKILGLIFNRMSTELQEYYYYQYDSYDPSSSSAKASDPDKKRR